MVNGSAFKVSKLASINIVNISRACFRNVKSPMCKTILNSLLPCLSLLVSLHSFNAHSQSLIKKCQDSNGKWHYGQHANVNCVSSVDSMRQDGVVVAEPVVNEPKIQNAPGQPTEFELKQIANDKAILLRYGSLEAIGAEENRKLSEVDGQLEILESLISKLGSDIAYYTDKEQTETVINQINQRQTVLLKYLNQQQNYTDKRSLLLNQYVSTKNSFIEATARLTDT